MYVRIREPLTPDVCDVLFGDRQTVPHMTNRIITGQDFLRTAQASGATRACSAEVIPVRIVFWPWPDSDAAGGGMEAGQAEFVILMKELSLATTRQ